MKQFTVTVSNEELKALEWDIYDVQEWIQNAISEKARRIMFQLIEQNTAYSPSKLTPAQCKTEISRLNLETAKERTKRLEQEMLEA